MFKKMSRGKVILLKMFFDFSAAHLPVRLDIKTKFLISHFGQPREIIRNTGISSLSSLTGKCAAQKF